MRNSRTWNTNSETFAPQPAVQIPHFIARIHTSLREHSISLRESDISLRETRTSLLERLSQQTNTAPADFGFISSRNLRGSLKRTIFAA